MKCFIFNIDDTCIRDTGCIARLVAKELNGSYVGVSL